MSSNIIFSSSPRKQNISLKSIFTWLFLYVAFFVIRACFYHTRSSDLQSNYEEIDADTPLVFNSNRHLLMASIVRSENASNCTPLAMENFPNDIFSQKQRQHVAVILHIFIVVYMFFALAILCDEYFIPCLERICETLHLQPDVAGATFMAAGSSAPELATTLIGVFIAKDDIGLGAVVGSADFNIMLVISLTALFAKQVIYLNWWPLVRDCTFYLLSIIILAVVIYDEVIHWYEAFVFLVVYVVYVCFMHFNPRIDAFWRRWCAEHDGCCTRIYRSPEDRQEEVRQHTGAFPHVADPLDASCESGGLSITYDRLSEEQDIEADSQETQMYLKQTGATKEFVPAGAYAGLGGDTVIVQPGEDESWTAACFGPLKLPLWRGGAVNKLRCLLALYLWPIRLLLCLTIPDVRWAKWRRVPASHWASFLVCCFWIGLFTTFMIWMITVIGVTFHIPDTIMGLVFIAAGSSVPDAITSVLVVREGEGDMAVSNAIGSNVFDILVCMGLPWFLKTLTSGVPVVVYSKGLLYSTMTLFSTVLFLLVVTHLNRWRLTKIYGVVLLLGYLVVLCFCSLYELNLFGTVHLPQCPLMEGSS